ncbi:MAG: hypothetical protein WCO97_04990 [bacterium]
MASTINPRDDDPRAGYALYDYQNRLLLHRRVEYDIARAQERFKNSPPATPAGSRMANDGTCGASSPPIHLTPKRNPPRQAGEFRPRTAQCMV